MTSSAIATYSFVDLSKYIIRIFSFRASKERYEEILFVKHIILDIEVCHSTSKFMGFIIFQESLIFE